jgi:hypothetical protein
MAFLARLSALAHTAEADIREMKSAAQQPAGVSGTSKCCKVYIGTVNVVDVLKNSDELFHSLCHDVLSSL